jgi:hypothetical protein
MVPLKGDGSSLLITLVSMVDRLPRPMPQPIGRGRPQTYSDSLFLKALVIMIVRRLHNVYELLAVLEQPTPLMQQLRRMLMEQGQYPTRRTFERRLAKIPETLPQQIGILGRHLVQLIEPWAHCGRAIAMDSTVLRAHGGCWHKKHKEEGVVPHTSIDTQAGWTKSGWHGWVYGWKLHLSAIVADAWIPLAAKLTPADVHDSTVAPELLVQSPLETKIALGDRHYNTDEVRDQCNLLDIRLITSQYGAYPHKDVGVEARRLLHKMRSLAMENLNEHFKGTFDVHGQVPTKGKIATARFALGAVLVYQLAVWQRHEDKLQLNVGLKHYLKAA